jgi:hypothetical protein
VLLQRVDVLDGLRVLVGRLRVRDLLLEVTGHRRRERVVRLLVGGELGPGRLRVRGRRDERDAEPAERARRSGVRADDEVRGALERDVAGSSDVRR